MKVNLIFAKEWTTKALEKDPQNIGLTGNRTITKWYFMKSYLINSITYYKGEERYKRENENIEYTANGKEKPPSSW